MRGYGILLLCTVKTKRTLAQQETVSVLQCMALKYPTVSKSYPETLVFFEDDSRLHITLLGSYRMIFSRKEMVTQDNDVFLPGLFLKQMTGG